MDLKKIGKFISVCRKEKGLTQEELGKKLGVTGKTISRWENGNYFADISLLVPLSNELGISLNELLIGERIKEKDIKQKSEESIVNTIMYTNEKIVNKNRIIKIILVILVLIIISISTMFIVDNVRMNNYEPVLFSTWGRTYNYDPDYESQKIRSAINKYLIENSPKEVENFVSGVKETYNTDTLVDMYVFDIIKENDDIVVYAWVIKESYFKVVMPETNEVTYWCTDCQGSEPYKITLKKSDYPDYYEVVDVKTYGKDYIDYIFKIMKEFPPEVFDKVEKFLHSYDESELEYSFDEQFNKKYIYNDFKW